jgi:hypothetical protein
VRANQTIEKEPGGKIALPLEMMSHALSQARVLGAANQGELTA